MKKTRKLQRRKIESYKIIRNIDNTSYELTLFKKMKIHSVFHAFKLEKNNQKTSKNIEEIQIEGKIEYEVEKILKIKLINERFYYFIR